MCVCVLNWVVIDLIYVNEVFGNVPDIILIHDSYVARFISATYEHIKATSFVLRKLCVTWKRANT